MSFDYKKEYKELYMPKSKPSIVNVPKIQYVAVRGSGDPNEETGEYANAVSILYGISYTIKMSYKGAKQIEGFFEYVVPPLEGLWWMGDGTKGVDYNNKSGFHWISMIRVPEFVTSDILEWAKTEIEKKKKIDTSKAELLEMEEGLCVQCLHIGSYDDEPVTVALMDEFIKNAGYINDINNERSHHEIYLSDPRKVSTEKLKTIIRHPIKKLD
jgi:hypothetical protein